MLIRTVSAIPPKVNEAFKAYKYVPYTAMSHLARLRAARGEEDYMVNAQGGLTAKGLDRRDENQIEWPDWQAAAHAAEDCIREHHGEVRAKAFASHHRTVMDLTRLHGWKVAVEYDIQQREAAAFNPAHDLTSLDLQAFTLIANRRPAKRAGSPEESDSPMRKKRQSPCFRCGLGGHLPADCRASTTTAGKPLVAIARGAKSKHGLLAPNGKQFCFNWARASSCVHGSQCTNFHGCSLCGDRGHGAGRCRSNT
jgi:hypothetical protein